jgi:hypothetical protein
VGLVDPYALPNDFLTPLLDVVPRVSSGPISTRATGDEVLAPIHRTDIVVATLTVASVLAGAKVQRVGATPSVDAVSPTVAVDSVITRGAYKVIRSVIALDHCGQGHPGEDDDHQANEREEDAYSLHFVASF